MNSAINDEDVERREVEQRRLSRLRHVEFMEELEFKHQRDKHRKDLLRRFRWPIRIGICVTAVIYCLGIAIISHIVFDKMMTPNPPQTVVIQMPVESSTK